MNRFRGKKKGKDDSGVAQTSEQSSMPSFKSFRRGKKSHEEPKKEIDLDAALPSSDDFRTSLLMTGLSARFSMLREQDDPNTKIGKASDDSVLFPKRQSRLMEFGYPGLKGLADIAEVESLKGAPSLARFDSFDDAESTNGGSIMSRGKPTEGNNLFGGRQKIYKISAGAASSKTLTSGGMGGRALYEDDVALSSFQKWRQAEKERGSMEDERTGRTSTEDEVEVVRSESPQFTGYNRKRETSSTMSSASALARNSTAATSIMSQPPSSLKDWSSTSTAPTSASSTPALERTVTRTRRLYEQGLTQELHEQQSSASSRIDNLSRQRLIGSRTPDLSQTPSPTNLAFNDRFGGERRHILTKASAPNLRTVSPPTTGSSLATMDLGIRVPSGLEGKTTFGGSPPLSPPISEAGENATLPIQPNDRGKATALGVFSKPVQPYDETKYAQRQLQLQQGRETPTQRFRAESNASYATNRSRSSSTQRQPAERGELSIKTQQTLREDAAVTSFLDDEGDSPVLPTDARASSQPRLTLQRPLDQDHPAFRTSALPTPLSVSGRALGEPSPVSEDPDALAKDLVESSPADSPTLGPTAGLSGMVRQHLRSESNTSSIYGGAPQSAELDSEFTVDPHSSVMDGLGAKSNPWMSSMYGGHEDLKLQTASSDLKEDIPEESETPDRSSGDMEDETDEFANQLANARRRVRERLTSYVETDSSREPSPMAPTESWKDAHGAGGLGVLKSKSSRGSLIDRSRSIVNSQSKAMKMLGIGASTMSTSPLPTRQEFEEKDSAPLASMAEEPAKEHRAAETTREEYSRSSADADADADADAKSLKEKEDEGNMHPGLRAFRQARRDLQRRKELETLARHRQQPSPTSQESEHDTSSKQSTPPREQGARQRTPSRERRPPPVLYQQRGPIDEQRGNGRSASGNRRPSGDRERSSSETNDERSRSRSGPRYRDDQLSQYPPTNGPSRQPMLRSPGLPGTDIRRSPIMPPQGYPGNNASPRLLNHSKSSGNLTVQSARAGYESLSGQPSPVSPLSGGLGLPPSPYGAPQGSPAATTPTGLGPPPRRPSAPASPAFPGSSSTTTSTLNGNDALRRTVKKNDISEPTLIMSTSRVPTVNLPQSLSSPDVSNTSSPRGGRSRAGSNAAHMAPPLPPINPRRKNVFNTARDGTGDAMSSRSTPHLPLGGATNAPMDMDRMAHDRQGALSASDDEGNASPPQHRRQRKANMDDYFTNSQAQGFQQRGNNGANFLAGGPPASRTVITPSSANTGRGAGVPGGMI